MSLSRDVAASRAPGTAAEPATRLLLVLNRIDHTIVPLGNLRAIDPARLELHVLSLYQTQREADEAFLTGFPGVPAEIHGLGCPAGRPLQPLFAVGKLLSRLRPDVIHTTHTLSSAVTSLATIVHPGGRLLFNLQNDFNRFRPLQKALMTLSMLRSEMIVCNSKSTMDSLGALGRLVRRKASRICYNGVDVSGIRKVCSDRPMTSRSRGDGEFLVGTAARLVDQKDIPTMLRGFARFHASRSRSRLLIAGDGPLRSDLETLAAELGIRESVRFLGLISRPEVNELLARLDVFVVSSLWEGFCNAMVEAMAAGLSIVASDIPVLVEVLGRDAGTFFEPGSPEELAGRLESLHADERRRALGLAAMERASKHFTVEAASENFSAIYQHLGRLR